MKTFKKEVITTTVCCDRLLNAGNSFEIKTNPIGLLIRSPYRYDVADYCPFCGKLIDEGITITRETQTGDIL